MRTKNLPYAQGEYFFPGTAQIMLKVGVSNEF